MKRIKEAVRAALSGARKRVGRPGSNAETTSIEVIELADGDVDRVGLTVVGGEIRLLIFASEDEPLIQARLSRLESFELTKAIGRAVRRSL